MSVLDKTEQYIDVNMVSGSRDKFRNEIGLYYASPTAAPGDTRPETLHYRSITDSEGNEILNTGIEFNEITANNVPRSERLSYIQVKNNTAGTTSSANLIYTSRKVPVRIIGNQANIITDAQWKAMILGGAYSTASYEPIYAGETFNDHGYTHSRPYNITEAKQLAAANPVISSYQNFDYYEIGYRYKMFLKSYEDKANKTQTRLLPNMYMLKMVDDDEDPEANFPEYLRNFVSAEGLAHSIIDGNISDSLFQPTNNNYPPPYTTQAMIEDITTPGTFLYEDKSEKLRQYLTGAFVQVKYSDETVDAVNLRTRTLYYNTNFTDNWFSGIYESDPDAMINKFPMYTKIELPIAAATDKYTTTTSHTAEGGFTVEHTTEYNTYTSIIKDNKLENEFLISLEKAFTPYNSEVLNYIQQTSFLTGSGDGGDVTMKTTTKNKSLAGREYMKILKDIYEQSQNPDGPDGMIMGQESLDKLSAKNPGSKFRYSTPLKVMKAIQDTITLTNKSKLVSEPTEFFSIQQIMNYLKENKGQPETVAYRIKKTEGQYRGSNRTITDTQNIYFMNDPSLSVDSGKLVYYDTQVKHGYDYQYKLYAYIIAPGYEYHYSDLRISRQIGKVLAIDESGFPTLSSAKESHCIEFYDPNTNLAAEQLLNSETNLIGTKYIPIESVEAFEAFIVAVRDTEITFADVDPEIYNTSTTMVDMDLGGFGSSYALTIEPKPHMLVKSYLLMTQIEIMSENVGDLELARTLYDEVYNRIFREWASHNKQAVNSDGTIIKLADLSTNRYASNAQIKSENPYLADFNFHWIPSTKVMEVPIGIDLVRILDNPPVAADVTPYQRKDDSQIIGFYINVESFRMQPNPTNTDTMSNVGKYPSSLNRTELAKKDIYLDSNNMLADELIKYDSVSKVSMLQVYRLDKEPRSLSEFENNLVYTKDLSMKYSPDKKYTNCFYEEKVQTNKKYYYLFRFLNEHGDSGYLSPIQVVELIDDGGYKYSTFDVIFETDLEKELERQEAVPMKKILQVSPALRHIGINDENADYGQPAASQLATLQGKIGSAEELIWGKTFKFRLTSKKTGRKIDFNIKYNLRDL